MKDLTEAIIKETKNSKRNNFKNYIQRIDLRFRFMQTVCAILIFSILTVSVPAAPLAVKVSMGELYQDIRFELLSNNFGANLSGWTSTLLLFLIARKQTETIGRIEIVPGDVTIRQGEPVNFSAVAYATDEEPIHGLKFTWTVRDVGRNLQTRSLANGTFPANAHGNFIITAKTEGSQAQVRIKVEKNDSLLVMKKIKDDEAKGKDDYVKSLKDKKLYKTETISSKKDYKDKKKDNEASSQENYQSVDTTTEKPRGPNAGNLDAEYENSAEIAASASASKSMLMRPIDEQGWNGDNWWLADDPGNQIGNPPGTSPDAGAGNGNFQFSAPVIALPGRGIDLNLSLNYNSRLWSKSGTQMSYDSDRGFPAPGWSLGFGKMMYMGTQGGCMMIDADGTRHGYAGTVSNYATASNFTGHTADGTFIDYNCYTTYMNGAFSMSASATLPNGTKIQYTTYDQIGNQVFPTQITDAQGNYISIAYRNNRGPEIQTITDTMGRIVTFNYNSDNRLISITAPKSGKPSTRTVVRLHYKQIALNPGFSGLTTDASQWNPYVIDAIYYPGTQTGYWFGADSNAADYNSYYSSYGMIAKVVEQRGMNWSGFPGEQGTVTTGTMSKQAVYDYPLTPDYTLTDAPTYSNLTESWAGMDTAAAVTNYDIHNNSTPRTITVTQPNGIKSKQYSYNATGQWYDGLIYQDETLDSSNNQLSKSVVTWGQGAYDTARPTRTEITDERGQVTATDYAYGASYNQLISQKEYDYNGSLLKETRNSYENSSSYTNSTRHIFNLVKTTEVFAATLNRVAKADFEYDNNAVVNGTQNHNLKATTGVMMHYASYDPYTAETQDGPNCLWWDYTDPYDPYGTQYCVEYEQVSAYDQNTIFRGNVTKTTGYANAATPTGAISQTKQFDTTGNLVAESASCCQLKTYDYTIATQFAYPTTQTRGSSDPNSTVRNTISAVYDFYNGLVKQTTDPNGRTSTVQYNSANLRPTITTSSTGAYSQTTYNDAAMTVTEETYGADSILAGKSITYLNGIGKVKRQETFGPNNVADIVETTYNKLGQVWQRSNSYRTVADRWWTETVYDIQGRTKQVISPDGSYSQAFYNEAARPDVASTLPGNTIRVADAWGRERWGRYDSQGRLAEVVEPNPNGNSSNPNSNGSVAVGGLVTKYTYDTLARLTETEQGVQHRYFKYDSLGRITRQKLAEQTATLNDGGTYVGAGQAGAQWSDAFWYDERSNVTQKTDARGVRTYLRYHDNTTGASDPLNRLQAIVYDLSGPRDTGQNINLSFNTVYEYMMTGDQDRIKKIDSTGLVKEEYTYNDPEGRVSDVTQTVTNRENYPMTTSYIYDSLSRVTDFRYPVQYGLAGSPRKLVQPTYDTASRLSILKVDGQQQAGDIVYNAADQTTSINIGTAGANQVNENYTFDPQTGLLTNQKVQRGAQTLLDLDYDYQRNNSVGNLNGKTGHLTKIIDKLNAKKNRSYEYDALGRLRKATGGQANIWEQQYVYDRYGNRESVTASGLAANDSPIPRDGIALLSYNPASNRITSAGFEYDAAGNQTRALAEDGTWLKYEYDTANRLSMVRRASDNAELQAYQYSPTSGRLMNYDYLSGEFILYANSGGTTLSEYHEYTQNVPIWTKSYVYLGSSVLSTVTPNGAGGETTDFNHPDRLGTRVITNQAAGTSSEQATLPFGTALNAESTITTNKNRFTSYDRSTRTGLDYAVNRNYDSKQGRFTTVDPIGMSASSLYSPQTLNLYSYCGNDPINHTDPSGLFWGSLFRWIGNAIASLVKRIIIAAVKAAITAAFTYITSGGNLGAAVASFIGSFVANLGFPKMGNVFTPSWNPNVRHPLSGASGLSSRYVIRNLLSTHQTITQLGILSVAGAIANFFANNSSTQDPCADKTLQPINLADSKQYVPSDETNINLIHKDAIEAFDSALQEINQKNGYIAFSDVFRDSAMQSRRRKLYESGKGPAANKPGTSDHESGFAFDVYSPDVNGNVISIFKKYGFNRTALGKNEKWHFVWKNATKSQIKAAQDYYKNCIK